MLTDSLLTGIGFYDATYNITTKEQRTQRIDASIVDDRRKLMGIQK